MSSPTTTANNHSSGIQYLTSGNGAQFSASGHSSQFNNCHFIINMPTLSCRLTQQPSGLKDEDKKMDRRRLAGWLMQQSGQPSLVPRYHHLDILNNRLSGTGTWVLFKKELENWKNGSSSRRILFMQGIFKSENTMLISIIIDVLKKQYYERKDIICVDLLLLKGKDNAHSAPNIWLSLLLQLLQNQRHECISNELACELENSHSCESYTLHPSRYFELFKAQAKTFSAVYLFIDGLDDCSNPFDETTQQEILNAIKDLPSNVRTLVTSRTGPNMLTLDDSQTLLVTSQTPDMATYAKPRIKGDVWATRAHEASTRKIDKLGMAALCDTANISQIEFLLLTGSKLGFQDEKGHTPLHYSVLQKRAGVVDLLSSRALHPTELDKQDGKRNTALTLATKLKKPIMMDSLLRHGASCDIPGEGGLTALHHAANMGFNDGLRLLVVRARNINLPDQRGYTALHHAVNSNNADAETVDILCTCGADLDVKQENRYSPRALAKVLGKKAFARQLLAYEMRVHLPNAMRTVQLVRRGVGTATVVESRRGQVSRIQSEWAQCCHRFPKKSFEY